MRRISSLFNESKKTWLRIGFYMIPRCWKSDCVIIRGVLRLPYGCSARKKPSDGPQSGCPQTVLRVGAPRRPSEGGALKVPADYPPYYCPSKDWQMTDATIVQKGGHFIPGAAEHNHPTKPGLHTAAVVRRDVSENYCWRNKAFSFFCHNRILQMFKLKLPFSLLKGV